jgi:hypothetical protein
MSEMSQSIVEQCIAPHEIQEGDLVAYLEGAASPDLISHITRCPACAAEVEALRQIDSMFRTVLNRDPLPLVTEIPVNGAAALSTASKRRQVSTKVRLPFRLAWPKLGLPEMALPRVALVFVVIFVLVGILTTIYYLPAQTHEDQFANMPAGVTVKEIAEVATEEVARLDTDTSIQAIQVSNSMGGGIIEKPSAIAPPRSLLVMLQNELKGLMEDPAAIAPPRDLLVILENELQTQIDDRALIYAGTSMEPYWNESLAVDPVSGITYLVWIDNVAGYSTLYAAQSMDGGQTLSNEVTISEGIDRAFNPILAIDEQEHLYLVWRTRHHLDINIYFVRSTDGGQTWSRSVRINEEVRQAFNHSLAVDTQGHLYVAWQNWPGSRASIYLVHSSDGGQTWSKEKRMAN